MNCPSFTRLSARFARVSRIRLSAGLLGLAVLSSVPLTAQISITSADMPSAGQSYRVSVADTLLFVDPDPTGASFTWDFSFLTPASQTVENWVGPFDTDFLYFLLFGASNVAQAIPVPEIADLPLEDAFNFYNRNSANLAQTGIAGKVGGVPLPIAFTNSDILFQFPMNFGNTNNDASEFEFEVPGLAGLLEERERANEVDGWGTLITPYGTFPVLRHRSVVDIRDSLTGSFGEFTIERRTIEYRWLGNGSGIPLLQIDVQEIAGISTVSRIAYQDSVRDFSTGLLSLDQTDWRVYPNPAHDALRVSGRLAEPTVMHWRLFDATGREAQAWPAEQATLGTYQQRLALGAHSPGTYILELRTDNAVLRRTVSIR